MKHKRYLSAAEAADELGVSLATLYAYVSRGMIRSEGVGGDQRARRYSAEDVAALKARKESRRSPEGVSEAALHYGMPVLESAITLIQDGRLYYRGQDAVELALHQSVEAVAALIWAGELDAVIPGLNGRTYFLPGRVKAARESFAELLPIDLFQAALPLAAADDLAAYDLRPEAVAQTGARILRLMVALISSLAPGQIAGTGGIASRLQQRWKPDDPQAEALISAALILCADHELNVSAFTARCVASAHATPYAVVSAGLAALAGSRHGGHTQRVEAFLREAGSPQGAHSAIVGRLRRGESLAGFGHTLYPEGDPRGRALLALVTEHYPDSPALELAEAMTTAAHDLTGDLPTIDFALVIMAEALQLPPGSPLALFAIGRTIGWIGHALEQYGLDRMIRPRARYIGEPPSSG
ncbi:MAG: citrate synthase family protein [Anaerolineae bacterium]|nr:citrate synthase family protein [Anaerolineae bacterium]